MTVIYVEPLRKLSTTRVATRLDARSYVLESLDGKVRVPFDNAPVSLVRGAVGLDSAPVDLVWSQSPGVEGGFADDVKTVARPVLLPITIAGSSQAEVWDAKRRIREVVRPGEVLTPEGNFRLVCTSTSGVRQLTLAYLSGLEGETRIPNLDKFGLNLLALDPYARERDIRPIEFSVSPSDRVMVSSDPATAGERGLSSSVVIGENMPVNVNSEVPVHVRMDVFGPFDPLEVSASTGLDIRIPTGIAAGSQFTAILDPRNKSFRLDGEKAAGLIARGSKIGRPFQPGLNNLNVAASGASEASRIVLSWRGGFRSLW